MLLQAFTLLQKLQTVFFQLEFLDFTTRGLGVVVYPEDEFWYYEG